MRTTILFEDFVEDKARVDLFTKAVNDLKRIDAQSALLELSNLKVLPAGPGTLTEHAAVRAAWQDGYYECLKDIFRFRERYVKDEIEAEGRRADFAAYDELYKDKTISEEEYEHFTGSKPIKF